jgi:uncharacterized membrane protein YkoI
MKPVHKRLILLSVTGVLAGTTLSALAETAKDRPFEGVVVESAVAVEQLPAEVQSGSIRVKDQSEAALAAQAEVSSGEAAGIAQKALPGKVVEARLDDENGYLVWEVDLIDGQGQETQAKIDAGNGRLLAVERGEKAEHEGAKEGEQKDADDEDRDEGEHSSWRFWEHHDQEGEAKHG